MLHKSITDCTTGCPALAQDLTYGRPPAEWCAQGLGVTVESLLRMCCQADSYPCFDNIADILDDKCCRTTPGGGFFGFLLPTKALHFSNVSSRDLSGSLWSMSNFVVLRSGAATKLQELEELGLMNVSEFGMKSHWTIQMFNSRPIADRVRVPWYSAYVYRFYHSYSEVVRQSIWEHQEYVKHRSVFESNLRERFRLAYGSHGCGQPEAGADLIMSDVVAMTWIAHRWGQLANGPLSKFVNLGARDGLGDDPLQQLLANPDAVSFALAVEMDEQFCASHRVNLPHVRLLCTQVTAADIIHVVDHVPPDLRKDYRMANPALPLLDVLKVDLDAADCDVIKAFLSLVAAKFVVTEVYDGFPPPVQFALHETDILLRERAHMQPIPWGCSLSYQVHLLRNLSYGLIWYGAGNAVFAHQSVIPLVSLPAPLHEVDCALKSLQMSMWPDSRMMRRWFYELPLDDVLKEVRVAVGIRLPGHTFTVKI